MPQGCQKGRNPCSARISLNQKKRPALFAGRFILFSRQWWAIILPELSDCPNKCSIYIETKPEKWYTSHSVPFSVFRVYKGNNSIKWYIYFIWSYPVFLVLKCRFGWGNCPFDHFLLNSVSFADNFLPYRTLFYYGFWGYFVRNGL